MQSTNTNPHHHTITENNKTRGYANTTFLKFTKVEILPLMLMLIIAKQNKKTFKNFNKTKQKDTILLKIA